MAALRFDEPAHVPKLSLRKQAALRQRGAPSQPRVPPRVRGGPRTCNVQLAGDGGGDRQARGGRAQATFGIVRDLPVAFLGVHLHELARLGAAARGRQGGGDGVRVAMRTRTLRVSAHRAHRAPPGASARASWRGSGHLGVTATTAWPTPLLAFLMPLPAAPASTEADAPIAPLAGPAANSPPGGHAQPLRPGAALAAARVAGPYRPNRMETGRRSCAAVG